MNLKWGDKMVILVSIGIAYVCYQVAKEKGRDAVMWAILGLLFGIFALILLVLIPKSNK